MPTEAPANPLTLVPPATPVTKSGVFGVFDKLVLVSWLNDAGKDIIYVRNKETNDVERMISEPNIGVVDGTSIKPENYNRENILRQLKQYEAYGVTTVTALGLNAPSFYQLRADRHEGRSPGADVFGADCGIGAPSGAPPAALLPVGRDQIFRPETPDEAKAEVREMADRHTDLIKIWVDPLLDTTPTMKPEIYRAVIDETHRLGLRVAAHIYYLQNAKDVLHAGVDIIAHGVRDKPVDAESIDEMKARSVFYVATIGLDETSYVYAEQPEWMKGTFFQTALQPALRAPQRPRLFK